MNLDLKTLKHLKFTFEIQSDISSTTCNGYSSLCAMIEEIENPLPKIKLENKICKMDRNPADCSVNLYTGGGCNTCMYYKG